jgi:DNA-binding transcriptional ArsR family regulator
MKSTSPSRARRISKNDRLDLVFGALSDRTRRALLAELQHAPAIITELANGFPMSLPAVSKHLRVLERAGLVRRTVDGRVHRCEIDAQPLSQARDWLDGYRGFWEENLDALASFVEGRKPE